MALSWFSFSSASLAFNHPGNPLLQILSTLRSSDTTFSYFFLTFSTTSDLPLPSQLLTPGMMRQGLALMSPLFPHFLYNSTILIYLASVRSSIFLLFISAYTSCHCLPFSILKLPSLLHSGWLPLQVPHCNWGLHPFPHVPALLPLVSFQDPSASVPSRLAFSLLFLDKPAQASSSPCPASWLVSSSGLYSLLAVLWRAAEPGC